MIQFAAIAGFAKDAAASVTKGLGYYNQGWTTANNIKVGRTIASANQSINEAYSEFNIDRQIEEGESFLSSQRSAIGRSGVAFNGSAIEIMIDSATKIEEEVFSSKFALEVENFEQSVADKFAAIESKYAKKKAAIRGAGAIFEPLLSSKDGSSSVGSFVSSFRKGSSSKGGTK